MTILILLHLKTKKQKHTYQFWRILSAGPEPSTSDINTYIYIHIIVWKHRTHEQCILKDIVYISIVLALFLFWMLDMLLRKFEKGHCRGILSASRAPMKALYIYGVRAIDENRGVVKFHKPNPQTSLTSWISSSCFVGSFRHGRWKKIQIFISILQNICRQKTDLLCVII